MKSTLVAIGVLVMLMPSPLGAAGAEECSLDENDDGWCPELPIPDLPIEPPAACEALAMVASTTCGLPGPEAIPLPDEPGIPGWSPEDLEVPGVPTLPEFNLPECPNECAAHTECQNDVWCITAFAAAPVMCGDHAGPGVHCAAGVFCAGKGDAPTGWDGHVAWQCDYAISHEGTVSKGALEGECTFAAQFSHGSCESDDNSGTFMDECYTIGCRAGMITDVDNHATLTSKALDGGPLFTLAPVVVATAVHYHDAASI